MIFQYTYRYYFPFLAQQPLVGQGLLTIEASRLHSGTPYTVGLLWTNDQPDTETSTWQQTAVNRDIQSQGWIWIGNPSKEKPQAHTLGCVHTNRVESSPIQSS